MTIYSRYYKTDSSLTFLIHVAVTIQFMPPTYTVLESDQEVEVCVSVPGSVQLERSISYFVQTQDGTAVGK